MRRILMISLVSWMLATAAYAGVNSELKVAVQKGDMATVQALLDKGVDVNAKDSLDRTALMWACENGDSNIVEVLLLKGADIKAKDKVGGTSLMRAAREGHRNIVQLLLAKGAEINLKDRNGYNALIWAALAEHAEIVELLKKAGSEAHYCGICAEIAIGFCKERQKWVCDKHKTYTVGEKTFVCF